MWALKPSLLAVNEYGFQGAAIPVSRTPDVKRILFLGDSCVNSGGKHFPEKAISKLKEDHDLIVEPLIAGVGGYSTYQGLEWLKELVKYKPDALVVYFGRNDPYALGGGPDNEFRNDISIIHETYTYLLEQTVAKHEGVNLVSFKDINFDSSLMKLDGIHPTEKGYDLIAERLVREMQNKKRRPHCSPNPLG